MDEILEATSSNSTAETSGTDFTLINNDAFWLNHILGAAIDKHPTNIEMLILRDGNNDFEYKYQVSGATIIPEPIRPGFNTSLTKLYRVDMQGVYLEELPNYTPREANMGNPYHLEWFLDFALETYDPSEYYFVLLLSDHGGAWKGFGEDETDNDFLTLGELRSAIANALGAHGLERLDMIIFEACLMGSIEVLYELQDLAYVMIASENALLRDGVAYALRYAMEYVADNPGTDLITFSNVLLQKYSEIMNPDTISRLYTVADGTISTYNGFLKYVADTFTEYNESDIEYALSNIPTLAIFNLTATARFFYYVGNMMSYIKEHLENNDLIVLSQEVVGGYIRVETANMRWILQQGFESTKITYKDLNSMKDFYGIVATMANLYATSDGQIFLDVATSYEDLIIDQYICEGMAGANGLSIYFPNASDLLDSTGLYNSTLFSLHFDWFYILNLYYSIEPVHQVVYIPIF